MKIKSEEDGGRFNANRALLQVYRGLSFQNTTGDGIRTKGMLTHSIF